MEGDDVKLPLFHGNRTEDLEKYWFLCKEVWTLRKTVDDEVKKVQLATTLWGRALDWYMKFVQVPMRTPTKKLEEVKKGLIEEF